MTTQRAQKLILLLVAAIGLIILVANLQGTLNSESFSKLTLQPLLLFGGLAIVLHMTGHWLRALKHRYLLEQIRPIRTADVFKGQMVGLLFNAVLPLRLGEIVRAHYIGKKVSISRAAVFATIVFERWLDAAILAGVGLAVLLTVSGVNSVTAYITLGLLGTVALLGFAIYTVNHQKPWMLHSIHSFTALFNKRIRDRLRLIFWSGIYGLKNVLQRAAMGRYITLSIIMWLCYGLAAYVLIAGLLPQLPYGQQILASVGAYMGVSAPTGPTYLGPFQDIFVAVSGINSEFVALGLWLLLVVPTSLMGLLFLLQRQKKPSKEVTVLDVLKNKLYRDADITKEFSQFLDAYFRGDEINHILNSQELSKNFQVIKTFKGGSNALTLLAWQDEKLIVKKITLKQYEEKLRAQYLWLSNYQKLPRITKVLGEQRNNPDYYSIDIEYRDNYIPFFDVIHSSSRKVSAEILIDVCKYVAKHIHTPQKPLKNAKHVLDTYISSKVIGKITDAANNNVDITHLLAYDTIKVNGRELLNFHGVLERITKNKQAMADLQEVVDCPIQGDLTVDNLIVDPATNKFLILDPNNENAISDPIVDYSKLTQSLRSGYEFLYYLESCQVNDNTVTFEERRSVQYSQLNKVLLEHLKTELTPGRYRALLFHEAVHYCRMLTYRTSINPRTAAAFYCIAVRLFNDFIQQYETTSGK
jgi:uncharacterized protein (TIRG00374 family)